MKSTIFAFALVLAASTGAYADGTVPTFALPAGTFNAPMPAGYCVAGGNYEALAKVLAAADKTNLTDITYVVCDALSGAQLSSWGMIKTPLSTLTQKAGPRAAVIAALKAQVNTAEGKSLMDVSAADVKDKSNLNAIFGPDFKGSAKFDALDSDSNGVYFGGVANYDDGHGGVTKVAAAYAITVVNDSVFSIYFFKPFEDVGDIGTLLAKTKAETATFVTANGG